MSENETPHSGSRWEPGANEQPVTIAPEEPVRPGRGRLALAAAAVGLVAAGGVGGFVLGQASAGNAGETGFVQNGVPGGGNVEGGTPGQFPGSGRPDSDGDHGTPPGAGDGAQAVPAG